MILFALFLFSQVCKCQQQASEENHVLLYYPIDKDVDRGFLKQLRHDVKTATARLVKQREEYKANVDSPEAMQRAFSAALMERIAEMNCKECENVVCRRYEMELNDPCVAIEYDPARARCKIVYKCKIVDIGNGQRTVAPIADAEARQKLKRSTTKIKYL